MSFSLLLSPFAQKYLLHERCLGASGPVGRILLDGNLNWHWLVREDGFFSKVLTDFDRLVIDPEPFFSDQYCRDNTPNQPEWDIEEPFKDFSDLLIDSNIEESDTPLDSDDCPTWRIESLAYYKPAHFFDSKEYGVHLTMRGVAKGIQEIETIYSDCPREILVLAVAFKFFAHEICHAWIEDLCCLLDFANGVKTKKDQRRYAKTNKRYSGYIWMEEAICNTAAHGWLSHFLRDKSYLKPDMPFDAGRLLEAFEAWMRRQPKGYRSFSAIDIPPHTSPVFIKNVCMLLLKIYKAPQRDITDVVATYFDGRVTADWRHFLPRGSNRWDTMIYGEVPLHTSH